jgi:hypothetical protein
MISDDINTSIKKVLSLVRNYIPKDRTEQKDKKNYENDVESQKRLIEVLLKQINLKNRELGDDQILLQRRDKALTKLENLLRKLLTAQLVT